MLTSNVLSEQRVVNAGLCNGSRGTVKKWCISDAGKLQYAAVHFPDYREAGASPDGDFGLGRGVVPVEPLAEVSTGAAQRHWRSR